MRAPRCGATSEAGDPRVAHVASERAEQAVEQQPVQHGIRFAEQPLDRASEAGELGDTPRGEQREHVSPHGVEQRLVARFVASPEAAPVRLPPLAQLGARAEEHGFR